jgi:hypothetical protein
LWVVFSTSVNTYTSLIARSRSRRDRSFSQHLDRLRLLGGPASAVGPVLRVRLSSALRRLRLTVDRVLLDPVPESFCADPDLPGPPR